MWTKNPPGNLHYRKNLIDQRKEMEIPLAGSLGSACIVVEPMSTIKTSAQHLAKLAGSVVNSTIFSLCVYKGRVFTTCKRNQRQKMSQHIALNLLEPWNTSIKGSFFVALCFFDENGETLVQCQLDTGATCNVMSFDKLCEIKQSGKPAMQPTTSKLRLYEGSLVQALGECDLQCKYKVNQHLLNFKIISGSQQPLLSAETCTGMGLITVQVVNSINMSQATMPQDIFTKYKDVFEGLGCLPGEYHLEVDPSCRPVKHTPRRVAIPLKLSLRHTLRN